MPEPPKTGPEAIAYALSKLTVEDINSRGKALLATGKKSKRSQAVKLLNIARGMERNQLTPSDYLISAVPVIPTRHRPFAVQGDTMIPGDANVLYKDLIDIRDAHNEEREVFGDQYAGQSRLALYDAVKSVYGYGDAVKPKTRSKDIQGFLKKITGSTSKFSYVQSKMLAKTQDNVGRSTIIADPDLSIDEIGIPKEMAFKMYAPYVQRRLKQRGYKDADALRAVRDQTEDAHRALQDVVNERPVLYSRAPAWYRFNIVAGKPKLTDNKALSVNPITIGAAGGDFDGNCVIGSSRLSLLVDENTAASAVFEYFKQTIDSIGSDFDGLRQKNIEISLDSSTPQGYTVVAMKITAATKVVLLQQDGREVELPIESIPYYPESVRKDKNGATVYDIPEGIKVLTTAIDGAGTRWSPITTLTVEDGCSLRKVTTRKKKEVVVSSNESMAVFHPEKGMIKVTPDSIGTSLVPVVRQRPSSGKEGSFDLGWIVGMFLSDGTFSGERTISLTKQDASLRSSFVEKIATLTGRSDLAEYARTYRYMHEASTNCGIGGESVKVAFQASQLPTWFVGIIASCYPEDLSKSECSSANRSCLYKKLPDCVTTWSTEALLGLFCGLIAGDGTFSINRCKAKPQLLVAISTSSPQLRDGILWLGKHLGLTMSYSVTKPKAGRVQKHDNYIITVSTPDLRKYKDQLVLESKYSEALALLGEVTDNPHDITPISARIVSSVQKLSKEDKAKFGLTKGSIDSLVAGCRNNSFGYTGTMRANAKRYIAACYYYLEHYEVDKKERQATIKELVCCRHAAEDMTTGWEYVTAVEEYPTETVYDIAVPATKVFALDNGLIIYDTINVHVPASDEAVKEAYEKLMPSSDPFSDRDQDKVVLLPKQEQILGLYTAATSDNQDTYDFDTEEDALKALKTGQVPLSANINIRQGVKMASAKENAEMKEAVEMHAKGAVRDPKTGKWMRTDNTADISSAVKDKTK